MQAETSFLRTLLIIIALTVGGAALLVFVASDDQGETGCG